MKDGWCYFRENGKNERWKIGEVCSGVFEFPFSDVFFNVEDVEIGDYIETPDKYKE